jgi:hypothetical protein
MLREYQYNIINKKQENIKKEKRLEQKNWLRLLSAHRLRIGALPMPTTIGVDMVPQSTDSHDKPGSLDPTSTHFIVLFYSL